MNEEIHTMHEGAFPQIFRNARALRKKMTPSEKIIWNDLLKSKKMLGFKFRRQHAFNRYILDFYCHELKLSIEVDGEIHNDKNQMEYDECRTNQLKEFGITEIRFKNTQVMNDIEKVEQEIINVITQIKINEK